MQISLVLVLAALLISCSNKNSNPKDYWQIQEEPEVVFWTTSSASDITPIQKKISDYKKISLVAPLGYQSYIKFNNLSPEIKFNISTKCRLKDTEDFSAPLSQIFNLERSNKIYIYNYIPYEVLHGTEPSIPSQDYLCDFKIVAKNIIGSEVEYELLGLPVNTWSSNMIDLNSSKNNNNNNNNDDVSRSTKVNPKISKMTLPTLDYSMDSNNKFSISIESKNAKLLSPGYVQCLNNPKFDLLDLNSEILFNQIDDIFFSYKARVNNGTTFLKKCRIVTYMDFENSSATDLVSKNLFQDNQRLVWSDFFHVIFEKPKLQLQVLPNMALKNELYPFNLDTYLDKKIVVAEVLVINKSLSTLKLKLPSVTNMKASLTPLAYSVQLPGFKPVKPFQTWGGVQLNLLPQSYDSSLSFVLNGEVVTELTLQKDSSEVIQILVDKNFRCQFDSNNTISGDYSLAERGFRIQAIELGSLEDQVFIEYFNQGQLEAYPEVLSLNQLFKLAKEDYNQVLLHSEKSAIQDKSNYLQVIASTQYAIDTLVLRSNEDLLADKKWEDPLASSGSFEIPVDNTKYNEVQSAKQENYMPKYLYTYTKERFFCEGLN